MKDINKEFENLAFENDEDFEKMIEKQIDRRIKKIAIKITVIAVLISGLLFLGISPLLNAVYVNAAKLNESEEGKQSELCMALNAYYEITNPYVEIFGVDVEKEGFGKYTLEVDIADHRDGIVIGNIDASMELNRGNLKVKNDKSDMLQSVMNRVDEENWKQYEAMEEIEKLPESSIVYIYVKREAPITVSQLVESEGNEITLQWANVYGHGDNTFGGGVRLSNTSFTDVEKREEMSSEELKKIYIANLEKMNENYKLLKAFPLLNGNKEFKFEERTLDKTIKEAEDMEELKTDNYAVTGTKADVLNYLKKNKFTSVYIEKIKLSYSS